MDSWYSELDNLKLVAGSGWLFLARLKHNRKVNPDERGNVLISKVGIPLEGRVIHLRGFGWVKVFLSVSKDRDKEYWATNDLEMNEEKRKELEQVGWGDKGLPHKDRSELV